MNKRASRISSDELEIAELESYKDVLELSNREFAEMSVPKTTREFNDTVSSLVKSGKTVEESVEYLMGGFSDEWKHQIQFFDRKGNVDVDKLPKVSLSLENGRQKLDFATIHYAKSNSKIADKILEDYLLLAEKHRQLKLLIATDRDDIHQKLQKVSSHVRNRITVQETFTELSIWAQDGSKPIDLPRTTAEFGQPRYTERTKELHLLGTISAVPVSVPGWRSFFQGGNIIVGDRNVFVGAEELNYVKFAFQESDAGALRVLSSIFQKPALPAYLINKYGGKEWGFHIDLDMVVAVNRHSNREVVLVHSPEALLTALSGKSLPKQLTDEVVLQIRDEIIQKYVSGHFGKTLSKGSREFLQRLSEATGSSLQKDIYQGRLFRRLLSSYGYETRALPGFGHAQKAGQSLFFGTNAVLTDNLAVVPGNEMPELDNLIRAEYEKLGYDVVQMKSSSESICQQGGIRCVSETYRKPYLTSKPNRAP